MLSPMASYKPREIVYTLEGAAIGMFWLCAMAGSSTQQGCDL